MDLNYNSCIPVMTMVVNVIYVFPLHLGPLSISDSFAVLVKSPTSFINGLEKRSRGAPAPQGYDGCCRGPHQRVKAITAV